MLHAELKQRGQDGAGNGAFAAPRGGNRRHKGIDYVAAPGTRIMCPISGSVTKLGYPYKPPPDDSDEITYRYVEVTQDIANVGEFRHRFFYVKALLDVNDWVVGNETVIGEVQDIAARYPGQNMFNHCHYEILDDMDSALDPVAFFKRRLDEVNPVLNDH